MDWITSARRQTPDLRRLPAGIRWALRFARGETAHVAGRACRRIAIAPEDAPQRVGSSHRALGGLTTSVLPIDRGTAAGRRSRRKRRRFESHSVDTHGALRHAMPRHSCGCTAIYIAGSEG
jgi:hypothetical protein